MTIVADDGVAALGIAVAIVTLFVGAEVARRLIRTDVETTRKATHVGAGVIVMAFPWLLHHTETLIALALSFAGILIGGRVTGLLGSIHDVERPTLGAYYYPFAVLGAWILSGGDALQFCVPLAVMAVADAGAAIVGQRVGETTYKVMDGKRSVEGSLAFFSLAFTVVMIGCALAGTPGWPGILLVALVVATLTTAVEAVSVRGSDNLFVPYATWVTLDHTARLGLDGLGTWIVGMSLGLLVLAASASRAGLTVAGGTIVFLAATLAWTFGGMACFLPLATLYGLYLAIRPDDIDGELDVVFPSTGGCMAVLLLAAHLGEVPYVPFLASVVANGAVAGWFAAERRGWAAFPVALVGGSAPVLVAGLLTRDPWVLVALPCGLLALGVVRILTPTGFVGRRVAASLMSAGTAALFMAGT